MIKQKDLMRTKSYAGQAQAIVEFAIVLPILLVVLIGIFEVGRYVFIYSAVTNASRNASRYASAVGYEETGTYLKYIYCDGIKNAAIESAYMINVDPSDVTISYDGGPGTSSLGQCTASGSDDTSIDVGTGDRVTVVVTADYKPMLNLIPITSRTITSTSSRTILGIIDLDN